MLFNEKGYARGELIIGQKAEARVEVPEQYFEIGKINFW